jgi:uncharacterized protein YndB with AHSA1/START domain
MPHIHHRLFIGASVEKIYDALTSKNGLSAWWTHQTTARAEPGSVSRFTFGDGYFKDMKIIELKQAHYVEWLCVAGAEEWLGTSISFVLEPGPKGVLSAAHPELNDQFQQNSGDNGTILTLHHRDWKDYTSMFAECSYTWALFMRSLKLFCETGRGTPWPNQHCSTPS